MTKGKYYVVIQSKEYPANTELDIDLIQHLLDKYELSGVPIRYREGDKDFETEVTIHHPKMNLNRIGKV